MSSDERSAWLKRPANEDLSRKLKTISWVFSSVVLLMVFLMQKVSYDLPEGWSTMFLVPFHASVNALV